MVPENQNPQSLIQILDQLILSADRAAHGDASNTDLTACDQFHTLLSHHFSAAPSPRKTACIWGEHPLTFTHSGTSEGSPSRE
jgi:hypothetical protein